MEKELKPILIITYYWPPSGGAGVQRWLKFSKYLPENGWRPIIFTPENPDFDLQDESLLKDVHTEVDVLKFPIWEPYRIFKKLSGQKEIKQGQILEEAKGSWLKGLSVWVRGNLFVPDPRIFWVRPSTKYLIDIIESNRIQHVITTGPPHSLHLIGRNLKLKLPSIIWLADFRDPWTEWEILHAMRITSPIWNTHRKLERQVLQVADAILATSQSAAESFKSLGARKTCVITNGFDESDLFESEPILKNVFRISHIGMLSAARNPENLWKSLEQILEQKGKEKIELKLTGIISVEVLSSLRKYELLSSILKTESSVPHDTVGELYAKSDLLLLVQTQSDGRQTQLPGKLFEYLHAKKPILCIGDVNSDLAQILKETNAGECFGYNDLEGISSFLQRSLTGELNLTFEGIEQFSRRNLTARLSDYLLKF
ncbi:MAG TPA: glycosyl transferase [Roseivirga sp.]